MAERVTIDTAGRLVIPKAIREQYGLHAGRSLEISTDGLRVVLEPVEEKAELTERNGILIITSDLRGAVADHRQERDERLQRLTGAED